MRQRAFTLAEVMVAMLFISIALFGYMSLHIRLMHSGTKLELRQAHREQAAAQIVAGLIAARSASIREGAQHVEAEATWEDQNGPQSYRLDAYERPDRRGW